MLGISNMQFARESIIPSRRACRSLFGPVDHDEVKKTLAREMDDLDSRQKAQWNFDFKNEVPLAGKFHWERVTPDDTRVPMAYKVMLRHLEPKDESSDDEDAPAPVEPEPTSPVPVSSSEPTEVPSTPLPETASQQQVENETTPPSQKPVSRKRKRSGQSTMTDFYPVTKVAKTETEEKH